MFAKVCKFRYILTNKDLQTKKNREETLFKTVRTKRRRNHVESSNFWKASAIDKLSYRDRSGRVVVNQLFGLSGFMNERQKTSTLKNCFKRLLDLDIVKLSYDTESHKLIDIDPTEI